MNCQRVFLFPFGDEIAIFALEFLTTKIKNFKFTGPHRSALNERLFYTAIRTIFIFLLSGVYFRQAIISSFKAPFN